MVQRAASSGSSATQTSRGWFHGAKLKASRAPEQAAAAQGPPLKRMERTFMNWPRTITPHPSFAAAIGEDSVARPRHRASGHTGDPIPVWTIWNAPPGLMHCGAWPPRRCPGLVSEMHLRCAGIPSQSALPNGTPLLPRPPSNQKGAWHSPRRGARQGGPVFEGKGSEPITESAH